MFRSRPNKGSRSRLTRRTRRGVAAVEAIPCILILLTLTYGTLEVCAGLLLKQSLTIAAFEGVRAGVGRGTNEDNIIAQTRKILEFRNVKWWNPNTTTAGADNAPVDYDNAPDQDGDYGIFVDTPNDVDVEDLNALDAITVRIVIGSAGNASPIFEHLVDRKISSQVTMVREFDPPFE